MSGPSGEKKKKKEMHNTKGGREVSKCIIVRHWGALEGRV